MKFYMAPGSCTTGIHILLEELEQVFEVYIVSLPAGDHLADSYKAINPKSTIPTLVRDDGRALTEFQAIAYWLARQFPKAALMPGDIDGDTLVMEVMDYVVGTLHGQGFARIFVTDEFAPNEADAEWVVNKGHDIVHKGFAILDDLLAGKQYVAGKFSIADAALFYVEFWADKLSIELPPNCQAHYQTMLARPTVRQVLREEGYQVPAVL